MKNWMRKQWAKIKRWWLLILVALGVSIPALSISVDFTYTPATEYTDGTPMPLTQIAETKIYCNGNLVDTEPGADGAFTVDLMPGSYSCYGTHVDIFGRESDPSNTITKQVLPGMPRPPVLD